MFGRWLRLEQFDIKRLMESNDGSQAKFAKILSETLETRKRMIMNTPLVLSAVYMDPRFRNVLTNNELKIAKETLYKWHVKMQTITTKVPETSVSQPKDSFEEYFAMVNGEQTNHDVAGGTLDPVTFALLLEKYEKDHPRIHHKKNIHEYWAKHEDFTIVFELAQFIHSIPPTQVDVEKGFSVVGFILSPLRLSLKPEALDDIIMIKLNEDLWHQINKEMASNLFEPDAAQF